MIKSKPTVLITGASSGIGWELAKLFARDGYDLVLVARDEPKLIELADQLRNAHQTSCLIIPIDLARSDSPATIFQEVNDKQISVEVLVNNAGFGDWGAFMGSELQRQLDLLQVNITALTHLTRLFLPYMVKKGSGKIMNVASTAAFQPGPYMAVYYASKAYVLSFTQAIASELEGTGVSATAFCPGVTRTNFHDTAGIDKVSPLRKLLMEPDVAAEIGYRGLHAGKRVVIPGLMNKLITTFTRHAPRGLVLNAVKKMQSDRRTSKE
ncbi:MAG: SDR family oxidoreductase [bacterium]|nr:SDR family oxidoreductase [bacterium]